MIVRDRPSALRMFFILRGSVLPRIWMHLAVSTLLAVAVTWTDGQLGHHKLHFTPTPFTLMGLPLAIFLGFRNNAAYDRYWEGRKQWGELVLRSRTLARQCLSLIAPGAAHGADEPHVRIVRRAIAYAHALRHRLRDVPDGAPQADVASCERIRGTPIPFSYTLLLHRTAYLYCFLLPFGLVDTIGYLTPLVSAVVAYTFFGLDALGDELEEPFRASDNGLPLEALCRTIEIDLRTALGEGDLPPPLLPENCRLS